MTNIAFVGCAHIHTPGFIKRIQERSDVRVSGVWDHNAARARRRAAELNAPTVEKLEDVLNDASIAAVIIGSETNRHQALVQAAAKAGKHLFAEKPLGIGSDDSWAMVRAIEEANVLFQTGYFQRGLPAHLFLRQQIQQGHFGRITRVRGANCHNGVMRHLFDAKPDNPADDWSWMADPAQAGGGAFADLGTHSLDILLWLFGEVERCTAQIDPGLARYPDCDETGEGLMRFKSGVIGTLAAGWDDLANPVSLQISGTEGWAAIIQDKLYFQSDHVSGSDGKQPWTDLPEAWPHPLHLFLDAVGGKPETPLVTPREAAYRVSVMEAFYAGAAGHQWAAPKVPAISAR